MAGHLSWFFLLVFVGVNLLSTYAADIEKDTCGGVCLKVLGRSGKVAIVRCGRGRKKDYGKADYGKAFTLEVDYVKQLNNKSESIGKPLNSLASQTFTFSALNKSASFQGLKAAHLNLKAYLSDPQAWLRVSAYIFCEEGNITFGDETFGVQNGTLKIFLKLENYTFCDGSNKTSLCKKDEVGESGEIALVIKSRKGKPPKKDDEKPGEGGKKKRKIKMLCRSRRCPKKFNFGDEEDGDEMVAASKCKKDGRFANMTGDYPKVVTKGNKQRLVFRFPRFANSIEIDPGVTLGEDDDDDGNGGEDGKSHASSIQINFFMFVAMVTALFKFM